MLLLFCLMEMGLLGVMIEAKMGAIIRVLTLK